ncbi:MAG: hypothetical protein ABJB21_05100 [bacterium]
MWVSGPLRPESIKVLCVEVLDGGKLQAVGWMADCLRAFTLSLVSAKRLVEYRKESGKQRNPVLPSRQT